jgi:uncharacterized OsmC-like protein
MLNFVSKIIKMATSTVLYLGELRCESTHLQSKTTILTDAPIDNHGKGESFSPTDLVATALGNCMVTIMGIEANRLEVNIDGTKVEITKHMGIGPRRITKIDANVTVPDRGLSEEQKELLTKAGINCPVAKSLHPDLIQNVQITYLK